MDHRSDQFTLGTILYEMATGRQPFRRETAAQTIAAIIDDTPEPLHLLCPALPPPVRWLIERCLAKDPGERYASTLDLAREIRGLREHISDVSSTSPAPSGDRRSRPRRWRARRIVPLGAILAVVLWWAGPGVVDRASTALGLLSLPAEKRVAVLPFEAPSSRAEDKARATGIAHLMTNRLAQLEAFQKDLSVEPLSNVFQAGVRSAAQARRALNATLVVTGSVQRVGGRVVLIANIEDTHRNRTVRAARAESEDALVEEIVRLLELELAADSQAVLRASAAGVAEAATLTAQAYAYTPYAEGRSALERYDQARSIERAIELFNQALERDPRYALAHAGLAEAFWQRYQNDRKPEDARLAEEHALRALEIDALPAGGWVTLGAIRSGTGRSEEALADFQQALDRDPRGARAHRERGLALERLERWDEAEASYRQAIALRQGSWSGHNYLGAFLLERNRLAEAEASFREALGLVPDNALVLSNLATVRYFQDRQREAEALWKRSVELEPSPLVLANLAAVQFSDGRYSESARTLERAVADGTTDYRSWRSLAAALYWAPGEREKAAAAYRRAVELAEQERRLDSRNPRLLAHLADCHAMLGDGAKARALAREAEDLAPSDRRVAATLAGVSEHLGDRDEALRRLGVALRSGHPRGDVESDPTFESLKKDPRWVKQAVEPAGR